MTSAVYGAHLLNMKRQRERLNTRDRPRIFTKSTALANATRVRNKGGYGACAYKVKGGYSVSVWRDKSVKKKKPKKKFKDRKKKRRKPTKKRKK